MATTRSTRARSFLGVSVKATVWRRGTGKAIVFSVSVSCCRATVRPKDLRQIASVTRRAERWIRARTR